MMTSAELRNEVRALVDSHDELLDYLDDIEHQPAIAAELQRLRLARRDQMVSVTGRARCYKRGAAGVGHQAAPLTASRDDLDHG
jgi:hypothetical protein